MDLYSIGELQINAEYPSKKAFQIAVYSEKENVFRRIRAAKTTKTRIVYSCIDCREFSVRGSNMGGSQWIVKDFKGHTCREVNPKKITSVLSHLTIIMQLNRLSQGPSSAISM